MKIRNSVFVACGFLVATIAFCNPSNAQTLRTQTINVSDYSALEGLNISRVSANSVAIVADLDRGGSFKWDNSNLSSSVSGDAQKCDFVPPTSDVTGASGAWVRILEGVFTPEMCGATGDGTTDDTTAVQAAINFAVAQSYDLYWRGAYLTTASLSSFHTVRHRGKGTIKRGSSTFYVEPENTNTNRLYVAINGSASNDGLSTAQPMDLPSTALNALANYGPVLPGLWRIELAAGHYDITASQVIPQFTEMRNRLAIAGPTVTGAVGEQIELAIKRTGATGTFQVGETITDGTSSATATVDSIEVGDVSSAQVTLVATVVSGTWSDSATVTGGTSSATATFTGSKPVPSVVIDGQQNNLIAFQGLGEIKFSVEHIKCIDVHHAFGGCVYATEGSNLYTNNVHVDNGVVTPGSPAGGGIYVAGAFLRVQSGVIRNTVQAVVCSIGAHGTFGVGAADVNNGPRFVNNSTGASMGETSSCHLDYTLIEESTSAGARIYDSSRSNMVRSDYRRNTVAVRAHTGGIPVNSELVFNDGNADANTTRYDYSSTWLPAAEFSYGGRNYMRAFYNDSTGTITGTTTETTAMTLGTVPGNFFTGSDRSMKIVCHGKKTTAVGTYTLKIKAGGTIITEVPSSAGVGAHDFRLEVLIASQSATNQRYNYIFNHNVAGNAPRIGSWGNASADFSTAASLTVTVTPANSSDSIQVNVCEVEMST